MTISASGRISATSAARASGWSSGSPDFAIITGSTTIGRAPYADSRAATAWMIGPVESMPDLDGVGADVGQHGVDLPRHEAPAGR